MSHNSLRKKSRLARLTGLVLLWLGISTVMGDEAQVSFSVFPDNVQVRGQSPALQLVVSKLDENGQRSDHTARATFQSLTPDVITVNELGRVVAVSNGVGVVRVMLDGGQAEVSLEVVDAEKKSPPDFETDIQPVLAARGCSTGPCHGKQGGKNGFQLSLLGFDSDFDYASLTKQARGRRLSLSAPDQSLLLLKATAAVPHGGGRRFAVGDADYQTLLNWIADGGPRRGPQPVELRQITVEPSELVMRPSSQHRLVVTATFSDGSRRDVTGLTSFSSNESVIAAVDSDAVVTAGPIAGEAAIMARYMGQIATCSVLLPRVELVDREVYAQLPRQNIIDELVWQKLARLNILPANATSDARFLRRAYLDIIGRQPSSDATRDFLADNTEDKRARLVEQLLDHPGYADHWANKWVDLLRPNPYRVGIKAVMSFDNWIRQAFRENWPYDRFVRELISAQGSTWHNGASTLFRDRRSPDELTTIVSQLFLGVRLECAKCHHHPFEVWGQDDFYAFAAFFARVGRKGTGLSPPISGGEEIVYTADDGSVKHPRTEQTMLPRALNANAVAEIENGEDPRVVLAAWMTSDANPYFARVIANRVWADLMGRGLVDPIDDMRATNPASNEPLLAALAAHLRENDYNLKSLIHLIATSYVYRLDSRPNETNVGDYRNYSRHYRERLRAEVLLDAVNQISETTENFDAMPAGSRPNEVWTHRVPSLFLDTFGRPDLNQDPPCERVTDTAVVQALHLMNSPRLHEKITQDEGFAAKLAQSSESPPEVVKELYLRIFCRYPTHEEMAVATDWFNQVGSRRGAIEDLLWAMLNSAEFVFKD